MSEKQNFADRRLNAYLSNQRSAWLGKNQIALARWNDELLSELHDRGDQTSATQPSRVIIDNQGLPPEIVMGTALEAQKQAFQAGNQVALERANEIIVELQPQLKPPDH